MDHVSQWEQKINSDSILEDIKRYFPRFIDSYHYPHLISLEKFLIASYGTSEGVPQDLRESIEAYISRGLKERYEGSFIDLSHLNPDADSMIGISYENLDHIDVCSTLVNLPFILGTGEYWVSLFETNEKLLESRETS